MINKKNIVFVIAVAFIVCSMIMTGALNYWQSVQADNQADKGVISPPNHKYFKIRVVDSATGRGIPLVELKTGNFTPYYTDSAGYVAYYEPGMMGQDVFFYLKSHGYEFKENSFGFIGKTLKVQPGKEITIKMDRINIAERLYRITGQGIYSDSIDLGKATPIDNPVMNAEVTGQDSGFAVEYNGRIYWFWNNITMPSDFTDSYRIAGATSKLPADGGLDPSVGVNLEYFTDENGTTKSLFPKKADDPPQASISGVMTVSDKSGNEKLIACYELADDKGIVLERGITVFDDNKKEFGQRNILETNNGKALSNTWKNPYGQAVKYTDNGKEYNLFSKEFPYSWPVVRVEASLEAAADIAEYESFSPFKAGSSKADVDELMKKLADAKRNGESIKGANWLKDYLDMNSDGSLIYSWKKDTEPITQDTEKKLLDYGVISKDEAHFQLKDKATGKEVILQETSIRWNEDLNKWTLIGLQKNGDSHSGEVWYSEASSATGLWTNARKVVTHDNYTFNNLAQHSFFSDGTSLYFEGTYTSKFTDNFEKIRTPKYDRNQIMYRLDLSDSRLNMK